jgi:hypothetical protein
MKKYKQLKTANFLFPQNKKCLFQKKYYLYKKTKKMTATPTPRVTLDQNEAQLFRRMAAQQAQQEQRNQQNVYNANQLRFLASSRDFNDYSAYKKQTDHFKSGFWLAVFGIILFAYFDGVLWATQPVDRYHQMNPNKQNSNDTPILGTMMRSTKSLAVNLAFAGVAGLYILPWTLYSVWSPADEYPQEANLLSIAAIHIRAYFLLQFVAPYLQVKLDIPPFLSSLKTEPFGSLQQSSEQVKSQGILGLIVNSPAIMKSLCAIGVPLLVGYVMFYLPFAKFWKQKSLVRHPLVLYAPRFGFVLLFVWWFVGTAAASKSIDSTISFLYNEVFTRQLLFNTNNSNNNNNARNMVLDFCGRIYGVILPYCAVLLTVVWVNRILPSLEEVSDFAETLVNSFIMKLLFHAVVAIVLSFNGLLTPDIVVALIMGIGFTLYQAAQRSAQRRNVEE